MDKKINHIREDESPVALCGYEVRRKQPYKRALFCQECVEATITNRNRFAERLGMLESLLITLVDATNVALDLYEAEVENDDIQD